MLMPIRLVGSLMLTTALVAPARLAAQQTDPGAPTSTPSSGPQVGESADQAAQDDENVDVSIPGAAQADEIVVTGRRDRDPARTSDQVLSVLSTAQIARTGEGNIAGALARVTGLSVVGNGFVYVRGLGDRYSLALLNGSPLPSPEPLRRVVPLDIFPSGIIASSLVQKSYSVNFPGEFGGGVVNLTTRAVPKDPFLTFGAGISIDTETTGELGFTYYGSSLDDTGFTNANRDLPPALRAYIASGQRLSAGTIDSTLIAGQLVNGRNAIVQRWNDVAPNSSFNLTGGKSWSVGDGDLGVIAAAGYSNRYQTRDTLSQQSGNADLSGVNSDFRQVNTDQRIVVNGLFGLGYEFGDNKIRATSLYVRDTIKQARIAQGRRDTNPDADFLQQRTGWFERQLIDLQLVEELALTDGLRLDIRAGYANSQREAPSELLFEYIRTNSTADPFGAFYVNNLNGNAGEARVVYSDLDEDLYSASADLSYRLADGYTVTVGGAWSDTRRTSSRRGFLFRATNLPAGVGLLRADLLLQPNLTRDFGIELREDDPNPVFFARLLNYAGYAKLNARFSERLSLDVGVRYEKGEESVSPVQVFTTPSLVGSTAIDRDYFLPAATLTFQATPQLQFRLNGSKTIARPQFRELIIQSFFDPDSNRSFIGNLLLTDSQLYNLEARSEYYFPREQKISLSAFFKRLNNPIESFSTLVAGNDVGTSFANVGKANLYGAELEVQKNFELSDLFEKGFFAERRFVIIGNYTYTKSKLKLDASDQVLIPGIAGSGASATIYFRDGAPLTGQSDHIVNVQLGLENPDRLSQQTFLLSYASNRVISRGLLTTPPQPDLVERPGFRLDFVAREGIELAGREVELKFEARNITGRKHEEYQQLGDRRVDFNTYDLGTTLALSASVKF